MNETNRYQLRQIFLELRRQKQTPLLERYKKLKQEFSAVNSNKL